MPRSALAGMQEILQQELRPWEMNWERDFLGTCQALRDAGAQLLDADVSDISITQCTTTGLEAIAFGMPWQPGDEVLIPRDEFPSNRLPWMALSARGVVCREVTLWDGQEALPPRVPTVAVDPEQRLMDAIGPRTRIVAVSWIRYQDGIRLDVQRLGQACRERGVHLVVDGIQGAGTTLASLAGVSAFASGGHKGLLGPQGQGLLWTSPELRALLMPSGTWLAAPSAFSQSGVQEAPLVPWATDGRRLEPGSPSIVNCRALAASLTMLLGAGIGRIEDHVRALQQQLLDALKDDPFWQTDAARVRCLVDHRRTGPTLCFHYDDEQAQAVTRLLALGEREGITASTRDGFLRIAFHGWHDAADVRRTAAWMARI